MNKAKCSPAGKREEEQEEEVETCRGELFRSKSTK